MKPFKLYSVMACHSYPANRGHLEIVDLWFPSCHRLTTSAIIERIPSKWPRPVWHRPWKNYRVRISFYMSWWLIEMSAEFAVDFTGMCNEIEIAFSFISLCGHSHTLVLLVSFRLFYRVTFLSIVLIVCFSLVL